MKIIAVMPAFNEEKTIAEIVKRTKKYVDSVIVIDDCSRDSTSKNARKAGAVVIRHPKNRGLGAALRTGFAAALKKKADVVITIDADGQHLPEEIPKFIEKINEGYDFVLGERNLKGYPFFKKFGNFFLNIATNFISGTALQDTESGFRAFRTDGLGKMYLKAERYEIAVEIVFESGRNYLRSTNVPIRVPVYVKGVGFFDGIKNFIYLLHRRERNWIDYLHDIKYVVKKWV
jgi:glycosyltransferase involved in cell wall biosynthesis